MTSVMTVPLVGGPLGGQNRMVRRLFGGKPFAHLHESGHWYRWHEADKAYVYVGRSWRAS